MGLYQKSTRTSKGYYTNVNSRSTAKKQIVDKQKKTGQTIHPKAISRHSTSAPSGLEISGIVRRQSQDFASVVGNCDGMLKVCR